MYSVYHFFADIAEKRQLFRHVIELEKFPFNTALLSCQNIGQFPDLAIKINRRGGAFSGGELIELKDSKTYSIPSFNSTIPTAQKPIDSVIVGGSSKMWEQMEAAGDRVDSLPVRDVFYLLRGRQQNRVKVVLVSGAFFETVQVGELINQSFSQALQEAVSTQSVSLSEAEIARMAEIFSRQSSFSKVRNVDEASVKLRFRVMTEAKKEGNLLNARQYPKISDNTLSLVLPCHNSDAQASETAKVKKALPPELFERMTAFKIKHHLNGYFIVFQIEV